MRSTLAPKTVRRLITADGFLDLGMPQEAFEELEKIEEAGPLEGPRRLLQGIALKQLENHREAIVHLEKAARLMPKPVRRFAWKELAECYSAVGSQDLADLATKLAGDGEFLLNISLPIGSHAIQLGGETRRGRVSQSRGDS